MSKIVKKYKNAFDDFAYLFIFCICDKYICIFFFYYVQIDLIYLIYSLASNK